jgi:HD-like signal output (HDOD) protein
MRQPDQAEMERLLKGVDIPPCPAVLTRLQQESASPNASLSVIATIIGSDVALSASVLKVANSTAFGLSRKVSTVQQALPVLGMRAVSSLVSGIVLKNSLSAAKARTLVSLAALAAYYVNGYQRLAEDSTWQRARTVVTAHLGINDNDLFDLRETAFETLESL